MSTFLAPLVTINTFHTLAEFANLLIQTAEWKCLLMTLVLMTEMGSVSEVEKRDARILNNIARRNILLPIRGPHLWVREVALPRYLSYLVPEGITWLPGPRGL
jgi:hypothetical protein